MKGVKWKFFAKFAVVLTSLFAIFVINTANTNAAQVSSVLGVSYIRRTEATGPYSQSDRGQGSIPYVWYDKSGSNFVGVKTWVVAASTGQTLTGKYYNGTVTLRLNILGYYNSVPDIPYYGGYYCDRITEVEFYPITNIASVASNAQVKSCRVLDSPNGNSIEITISTSGQLIQSAPIDSYRIHILSDDNAPFVDFATNVTNIRANIVMNGMNVDFTMSDDSSAQTLGEINQSLNETNDILKQQQQQDAQDRQDLQNQQDNAESSAEQSGQAVTDASDSLLVIMGNFIDIVLHPPTNDCKIDADMGHMDLGEIDLCSLPVPPVFGTLATVLLIGLLIPFVISLINTFLNLMKGATQ